MINIHIKKLEHGKDLPSPQFQTAGAAACDLYAAINQDLTLKSGEYQVIPSGFAISLPKGYEAQIRPRSGLAAKSGVTVLNSPGTIDADYRGEIGVILINLGKNDFVISPGLRIAQMLIMPCYQWKWIEVDNLDETHRGEGGFGSTGR